MIIYRAYNKRTELSYVGQTIHTLKVARESHYSQARYDKERKGYNESAFHKALVESEYNDWKWDTLEKVKYVSLLDERKVYWIDMLDTYKNGYNGTRKGNTDKMLEKSQRYRRLARKGQYHEVVQERRRLANKDKKERDVLVFILGVSIIVGVITVLLSLKDRGL